MTTTPSIRYDRAPLGALQGLAPDRVVYMGTVSKTLAPALRLGWLVLPARLIGRRRGAKSAGRPRLADARSARARAADRERRLRSPPAPGAPPLPRATRRARAAAVARHLPGARVTGLAAGLHADRAPRARGGRRWRSCRRPGAARSACIRSATPTCRSAPAHDGLILGYANLAEPAIEEGVRGWPSCATAARSRRSPDAGAAGRDERGRRRSQVVLEDPAATAGGSSKARPSAVTRAARRHLPEDALAASSQRYLRACASEKAP